MGIKESRLKFKIIEILNKEKTGIDFCSPISLMDPRVVRITMD